MSGWLSSQMPDPTETAGTQRKPFDKQKGIYVLAREAGDTELVMLEPNGDTYILEYFECERFLKGVLQLDEMYRNRILDYLWNFFRVAFDPDVEHVVILRTVDPEGWENEVKLSFRDKSSEDD
jgi:hypothetical protein